MKKNILFLVLMSLVASSWAQDDVTSGSDSVQNQPSWKQQLYRHEVHFSMGDPCIASVSTDCHLFSWLIGGKYVDKEPTDWFTPDEYKGITWSSFAINAGYAYRAAKWFWVGGNLSYCGFYTPVYNRPTGVRDHFNFAHVLSVIPTVRFSWVNTRIVTCYSELGLGFSVVQSRNGNYKDCFAQFTGQLTAVGVHVGRQWYGSAEVGVGPMGFFRLGFGYHFNGKKN